MNSYFRLGLCVTIMKRSKSRIRVTRCVTSLGCSLLMDCQPSLQIQLIATQLMRVRYWITNTQNYTIRKLGYLWQNRAWTSTLTGISMSFFFFFYQYVIFILLIRKVGLLSSIFYANVRLLSGHAA